MKQTMRALGWATTIFWMILLFFTITAIYSALQVKPGFGRPNVSSSGGGMAVSIQFSIANGGFYDIFDMNLTTAVKDEQGFRITSSSTVVPIIQHGSNVSATHGMSIDLSQLSHETISRLLFNDTSLDVDVALKADYAKIVPVQISTSLPIPWGAPLSDLTFGTPSITPYNATHVTVALPFSFENHSSINLEGSIRLELVNNAGRIAGRGQTSINAPSRGSCNSRVNVRLPVSAVNFAEARLYFETSAFNFGPVVIPLG